MKTIFVPPDDQPGWWPRPIIRCGTRRQATATPPSGYFVTDKGTLWADSIDVLVP